MALRGKKNENFVESYCAQWLHEVWKFEFHPPVFKKVTSAGLSTQQPLTEIVLISIKNWIFDDPFLKKGPVMVILVPGMIQPSQSVTFLMK